ncbi:MAG: glycosyl transferase family protein [Bacteroidetes bacterium]|nr:glycosyl transferase family protein [Bacteroidota bacterium]
MNLKKVLIFIDWYLPGYKAGGPIQSVSNLVEHLKEEFEFSIITRDTDYMETTPYPGVKSNEWNTLPNGVKVYYISQDQLTRSNVRNLIRKSDFDSVYLNGIYSLYFTLIPLMYLRKKHDKNVVIAARGMFSEGSMSIKKTKKQFFIRAVKVLKLFDNVMFHATTEAEKHEIRAICGDKMQIRTAANLPQKNSISAFSKREKEMGKLRMVNVARIAPEKNLLCALQVLKQVKEEVEFDFYGPVYDQEYWSECKLVLDELPQNVKANYKGSIDSGKVPKLLKNYHFMFMPTTGENFGHIILQSLSAGTPVIISDQTPWKHLPEKHTGWDLPLDKPSAFAEAIDSCASMAQADYDRMSKAAYQQALEYVNNPAIIEQNRHLFL